MKLVLIRWNSSLLVSACLERDIDYVTFRLTAIPNLNLAFGEIYGTNPLGCEICLIIRYGLIRLR